MLIDALFVHFRDTIGDQNEAAVPLVVLEVLQFDMRSFGITRVVAVDPWGAWATRRPDKVALVETLLGKEFCSFGQACQIVFSTYHGEGGRTVYMDRFEIYARGDIDPTLLGCATDSRIWHGERVTVRSSPALAAVTAQTLHAPPPVIPQRRADGPWEGWIQVGVGRPYAHSSTPPHRVEQVAAQMQREVCFRAGRCAHARSDYPWLLCSQGAFAGRQQPRDYHKRSYAEANPLVEGEARGGKSRKSSKSRAKALQPGRLVFIDTHRRSRGGAHLIHPHVVVSSGPMRLEAMQRPANCLVLQPLPVGRDLPEKTLAASEVVGLAANFEDVWRAHVAPDSLLEEAMVQAVHMQRCRSAPPPSFSSEWERLAPGVPEPNGTVVARALSAVHRTDEGTTAR